MKSSIKQSFPPVKQQDMLLFSEEAGGICVGASAGKFGVGALKAVLDT